MSFLRASAVLLCALPVLAQDSGQRERKIAEAWDAVLAGSETSPAKTSDRNPAADFAGHFYFESRTEYWRYSTSFTGLPTASGVINQPFTGLFTPTGVGYPPAFQPAANRLYSVVDWGTRGWLSGAVNTHFAYRYEQDLTQVDVGAPGANIIETYHGNRALQLTNASVEVNAKDLSIQVGRQSVYGAEMAGLDGASVTVSRPRYQVELFGGRRFTFDSDPRQRAIGGVNVLVPWGAQTSLVYEGLWYIHGTQRLALKTRLKGGWLLNSGLKSYGGALVDFDAGAFYGTRNGNTTVRLGFFQKLTNRDYYYDFTYSARDLDARDPLLRLYLGPIQPYSQVVADLEHSFTRRLRMGGAVWIRRLNSSADQGPFDTSFQDYRARVQYFPVLLEYHQRDSDRLSPFNSTSLDDVATAGETSVKDWVAQLSQSFQEGRMSVNGGVYYRRISLQDQFTRVTGAHQAGWLAGAGLRLDAHSRLYVDYNLDNDFFVFRPAIANSRVLHLGLLWKY